MSRRSAGRNMPTDADKNVLRAMAQGYILVGNALGVRWAERSGREVQSKKLPTARVGTVERLYEARCISKLYDTGTGAAFGITAKGREVISDQGEKRESVEDVRTAGRMSYQATEAVKKGRYRSRAEI